MKGKCWECDGKTEKRMVDFSLYGVSLGKFEAEVCTKCGEESFSEEVSDKIAEATKAKGLWGLETDTKVAQSGDSLMIRVSYQKSLYTKNAHPTEHQDFIMPNNFNTINSPKLADMLQTLLTRDIMTCNHHKNEVEWRFLCLLLRMKGF